MYFAAIGLSLRRNRWGYFIGLSAAAFWDYSNLFATTFFRNGLHWLSVSINNGELQRLDQLVAVPAWVGNFLVVVGSLWGYGRLQEKHPTDIWRFVFALVLTTAFFAADMYLYQPRYLSLFPRLLHPHWP